MKFALVTAIYPAVTKYLWDFFESLRQQSDQDYELWIGLDGISEKEVLHAAGLFSNIYSVKAPCKATPAVVRNKVLEQALQNCDTVALVDADDILDKTRVEAAKNSALKYDVTATAMQYVDNEGEKIEGLFDPSFGDPSLVMDNVFGFSNTTWRSQVLAKLTPVPVDCVLMDWFVSSLALYSGATLGYDRKTRMYYRQHPGNIAASRPPFIPKQIIKATELVLGHYELLIATFANSKIEQIDKIKEAKNFVAHFFKAITKQDVLEKYVAELNALPDRHVWWSCVAHPELEEIWK